MACSGKSGWLPVLGLWALLASEPVSGIVPGFAEGREAYGRGEFERAREIWTSLASRGDADAQFGLGILCSREPPVANCDARAGAAWYVRAATAGHRLAQFNLGMAYRLGKGVDRDEQKAAYWFAKAAEQGLGASIPIADDVASARPQGLTPLETADVSAAAVRQPAAPAEAAGRGADKGNGDDLDWLRDQVGGGYTVQIAAGSPDASPTDLRRREGKGEDVRIACLPQHCFVLLGVFATREAAWRRIEGLPPELRTRNPWPRRFDFYQSRLPPQSTGATPP